MYLHHLSLTNFRTFSRLDLDASRGTIVLVGDNAQGKTSILEAVYLLATLTSFQAESDRQLIHFIAAREPQPVVVARVQAEYQRGSRRHHMEVRVIQERNGVSGTRRVRKEVLIDGRKHKVSEAVGHFNAVLFLPQMLRVIDGAPKNRRRYLDLALAQVVPDYTATLSTYNRVLSQRNALLKQLNEQPSDPGQLLFWDEQLAALGARLIYARIHAVQELERLAALIHHDLTQGREVLRLNYCPAYDPLPSANGQYALALDDPRDRSGLDVGEIERGFMEKLQALRREEIARGVTTIGPHRDELRFLSNGIDLGTYGSRGQIRTALLAIKLAEVEWMKSKTGQWPVLLLDEVLAELDHHRREDLQARAIACDQVLMTTTDLSLFSDDFLPQARIWEVREGRVKDKTNVPVSG